MKSKYLKAVLKGVRYNWGKAKFSSIGGSSLGYTFSLLNLNIIIIITWKILLKSVGVSEQQ